MRTNSAKMNIKTKLIIIITSVIIVIAVLIGVLSITSYYQTKHKVANGDYKFEPSIVLYSQQNSADQKNTVTVDTVLGKNLNYTVPDNNVFDVQVNKIAMSDSDDNLKKIVSQYVASDNNLCMSMKLIYKKGDDIKSNFDVWYEDNNQLNRMTVLVNDGDSWKLLQFATLRSGKQYDVIAVMDAAAYSASGSIRLQIGDDIAVKFNISDGDKH